MNVRHLRAIGITLKIYFEYTIFKMGAVYFAFNNMGKLFHFNEDWFAAFERLPGCINKNFKRRFGDAAFCCKQF